MHIVASSWLSLNPAIIGWKAQSQILFESVALEHLEEKFVDKALGLIIKQIVSLETQVHNCTCANFFFYLLA
jgi:hypothetical protein